MKKATILLILCSILFQFKSYAQTTTPEPVLNFAVLQKKLEKSNEAIQDVKKSAKAKTWLSRAKLMVDIYDVDIQFTRLGIPLTEMQLYPNYANPLKVETTEHNEKTVEAYTYDRAVFYFENKLLIDWKRTEWVTEDPLEKALEAYKKAIELDENGKIKAKIEDEILELKTKFEIDGIRGFNSKNYEMAFNSFINMLKCNELPVYETPVLDTAIYYNAALAASNNDDQKTAIEYFYKAKEHGYGGANTYLLIKKAYLELQDSVKVLQTLKDAFDAYPNNNSIIVELINYYLSSGESVAALEYIRLAKESDPENTSFLFAEGTLHDKMGDKDAAVTAYKKAIEIDPEYFNAYYNLGVLYYNRAVEHFDNAAQIVDNEEYERVRLLGVAELERSLPYMEKAHQIEPNDVTTMETLKTLYYRLKKTELHDEIVKKLEALKK